MKKHTPGPWYVQDDHGKRWIETDGNDDTIAEIHRRISKGSVYSCEEASANSSLISSAPDLLEVLESLFEIGVVFGSAIEHKDPHCQSFDEWADKARSAIAKARGN